MLTLGRYIGQKTLIIVPPSKQTVIIEAEAVPSRGSMQHKTAYTAPADVTILREEIIRWKSCAEWPAMAFVPENRSVDLHDSKCAAEAVCYGLRRYGLGGDGVHFPVRTWVEPVAERLSEAAKAGK